MQTKSKLGKSLMHTIEGGRPKDSEKESVVDDAFTEAEEGDSLSPVDQSREEPVLGDVSEGLDNSTVDEKSETSVAEKPEKVQKPKRRNRGGLGLALAMMFSILAVCIAVFSVFTQRANQTEALATYASIDEAIGNLTLKTDEISVDVSGTQKSIETNQEQLGIVQKAQLDVSAVQSGLASLKAEMLKINAKLDENKLGIDQNKNNIGKLTNEVETLSNRPLPKIQSTKKTLPKNKSTYHPSMLEDATVASIDQWGTQSYVMLRNGIGEWIPLTRGDYYKGWRFDGADSGTASFKKGSKTRRLTIQE